MLGQKRKVPIESSSPSLGKRSSTADQPEANLSPENQSVFSSRTNARQSVQLLNELLPTRGDFSFSSRKPIGMRCEVTCNNDDFDTINQRYRFMYTSQNERAVALEKQLVDLRKDLCRFAGVDEEALQPFLLPSQELSWFCGRICCEVEGKLNPTSLLLESPNGQRVVLDVTELPSFSLFPGQIVLVEGINATGRKIVAKRLIDGVSKLKQRTPVPKLLEYHHAGVFQNGKPLEIFIACGPFTTSENLNYEPLVELLRLALARKPDVVVLIGPFVDISQPLLSNSNISLGDNEEKHAATFEMVFVEKIVRDGLKLFFDADNDDGEQPTQFVLVPSLSDGHHDFVFPQPPFGDRDKRETDYFDEPMGILNLPFAKPTDPKRRVHLMSNPCAFRINEVLFAACSHDILFSLSQEEISKNYDGHRLSRLAGHVLKQQSFCPSFPPSVNVASQLDYRHSKHWRLKVCPDVLILPSKLSHFVKDFDGVVVVNPGSLARGSAGGTFAEITIHPISPDHPHGSDTTTYDVNQRCRVNIIRI